MLFFLYPERRACSMTVFFHYFLLASYASDSIGLTVISMSHAELSFPFCKWFSFISEQLPKNIENKERERNGMTSNQSDKQHPKWCDDLKPFSLHACTHVSHPLSICWKLKFYFEYIVLLNCCRRSQFLLCIIQSKYSIEMNFPNIEQCHNNVSLTAPRKSTKKFSRLFRSNLFQYSHFVQFNGVIISHTCTPNGAKRRNLTEPNRWLKNERNTKANT